MKWFEKVAILALLAASLVFLTGTANAAPTVHCVPSLSVDPSCIVQAAVTASAAGDIIIVGPGTYFENVVIDSTHNAISLFGAQAGVDARHDRGNSKKESMVDAAGMSTTVAGYTSGSGILVAATDVVIDGGTAQGSTMVNATGIDLKGSCSPLTCGFPAGHSPADRGKVVNNILQDNSTGVSLNSETFNLHVKNVLVEHNLFRHNNALTSLVTLGNTVEDSTLDGIFVNAINSSNLLTENVAKGNHMFDCHDSSVGVGTLGTANTWFKNVGKTSSPAGLCMKK